MKLSKSSYIIIENDQAYLMVDRTPLQEKLGLTYKNLKDLFDAGKPFMLSGITVYPRLNYIKSNRRSITPKVKLLTRPY